MGPGYFVIAILGCADGGSACTPVATLPTHYTTSTECTSATVAALEANSDFDFPTLLARCRPAGRAQEEAQRGSSDGAHDHPMPAAVRRG